MKDIKKETIIYKGLGFPIKIIDMPLKLVFGEWMMDIDFQKLDVIVLNKLVRKRGRLKGGEIRFIIDFLDMSTREFAKTVGVSHVAVLKWIDEKTHMNICTEIWLRLHLLGDYLYVDDKEYRQLSSHFNPNSFSEENEEMMEIDSSLIERELIKKSPIKKTSKVRVAKSKTTAN
jgi:hypothetical protein